MTDAEKTPITDASEPLVQKEIIEDVETSQVLKIIRRSLGAPPKLKGKHRLVAEKDTLNWSIMAVRFGVLADAASTTILQPNFPFIAREGATDDSFDSTSPFGFSAATYFLPMTAMLGAAITSAFIGSLSDRIGRRPCMLICVGVSVFGTIGKWLAREDFWTFCAVNFVNGLFGGAVPVALAYASDVHPSRHQKDTEIGILIGFNMIGMSGGGIAAILMEEQGLFSPLFVGSASNFIATIFMYFFMIEPDVNVHFDEEIDEGDNGAPQKINNPVFFNVIAGALFDNIGSSGLYPMTLSPLAFEIFLTDFVEAGQSPIMSPSAFKWISVMVALMVIPGAVLSQPIFAKIGPAGGCVFGNLVTAMGICACLYICQIEPPTTGTLAGFVVFLYMIFPLTVVSQLSTGPMLDKLAPAGRRGYAQGLNITVMNFANAVAPWALGTFADKAGISATLWTAIGISLLAALVNLPLSFAPDLKLAVKEEPDYQKATELEDKELVERTMRGEYVPARFLADLNDARRRHGLPFLVPPVAPFKEDKPRLAELRKHGKEDFEFWRMRAYEYLAEIDQPGKARELAKEINESSPSQEDQDKQGQDLGLWFGEYLKDSGYLLDGGHPTIFKQMIMKAFPLINADHEVTEENIEKSILRYLVATNRFLDEGTCPMAKWG